MHRLKSITLAIVLSIAFLTFITYLLPTPSGGNAIDSPTHASVAALFFFAFVHFGAAILFLIGLTGFKETFKQAYYFISSGMIMQGISGISLPFVAYLFAWKGPAMVYTTNLIYACGMMAIYIGIRTFAKLLSINHLATRLTFTVITCTVVAVILRVLPHTANAYGNELSFDIAQVIVGLELALSAIIAWLIFSLLRTISTTYRAALTWFGTAVTMNTLSAALFIAKDFGALPGWATEELVGLPYLLGGALYLAAAYQFAKISHSTQTKAAHDATLIDCIVFTASLASNSRNIDPLLDQLRSITSSHGTSDTLTAAEKNELEQLYLQLETYLVEKEAVRSFTRKSLRQELMRRFEHIPQTLRPPNT